MATISKKDMGARAQQSATLSPNIEDRLRHARDLAGSHPAGEVNTQAVAPATVVEVGGVGYVVGSVYQVPVSKVRENPMNARAFYSGGEVDLMALSLAEWGQDIPAKGYVSAADPSLVILVDGQKRLRGAVAAGLPQLRVEICEQPIDDKSTFLASRRINKERSTQTALDDAVRFQALLNMGVFKSQDDLVQELRISQPTISRILALNKIPSEVMRRMKDHPHLTGIVSAHAISQIFTAPAFQADADGAWQLAWQIIDQSVKDEVSGNQLRHLVESKLAAPKERKRKETRHVQYAGINGVIKTSPVTGSLDFSIKGLSVEQVDDLRKKFEDHLALWSTQSTKSADDGS